MRRILAGVAAIGILFLGAAGAGAARTRARRAPAPPVTASVASVVDGDTLVVRLGSEKETVRLVGIDAPERGEYFADEATAYVRRQVSGRTVRLVGDGSQPDRDTYGRLLRYVELADGRSLNEELLRRGLAFTLARFSFDRQQEYRRLETEARSRGDGLWASHSVPELTWLAKQRRDPVELLPMSNRSWAIRWRGWVRLRVRGADLPRALEDLRHVSGDPDSPELVRRLESKGWIRL